MEAAFDSDYVNDSEDDADQGEKYEEPKPGVSSPPQEAASGDFESIFRDRKLKKRRAEEDDLGVRKKKAQAPYSNAYRELFNRVVEEVSAVQDDVNLAASVIGITEWSITEKALLFSFIEKHGQGDLHAISTAVGTKSPPEVNDYLLLLRQRNREHDSKWEAQRVRFPEIPAAVQLSEDCCAALDRGADGLASCQFAYEEELERSMHGDYWLLDEETVPDLEAIVMNQKSDKAASPAQEIEPVLSPELRTSLELLNIQRFIELSSRIFMNPGPSRPFDNWATIAAPSESPSIFATAFIDFRSLVLSFTKRLISTTLFLANSRLRANDVRGWRARKPQVKRRDVSAALKMLNVKQNSDDYWGGVARRLGLEIYDIDARGSRIATMKVDGQEPMTYDEVEARMRDRSRSPRSTSRSRSRAASGSGGDTVPLQSTQELVNQPGISTERATSPVYTSPPPSPLTEAATDFSLAQDAYASSLDRLASVREEYHMWDLLGEAPPLELPSLSDLEADMPKHPKRPRKLLARLEEASQAVHWRDRVEYRAEWERYGARIPEEAFGKLKKQVRQTSVGLDNDDGEDEEDVGSGEDEDEDDTGLRRSRAQTPAVGLLGSREVSTEDNDGSDTSEEDDDIDADVDLEEASKGESEEERHGESESGDNDDEQPNDGADKKENATVDEDQEMPDRPPSPDSIIPTIENRCDPVFTSGETQPRDKDPYDLSSTTRPLIAPRSRSITQSDRRRKSRTEPLFPIHALEGRTRPRDLYDAGN